MRLVKLTAPLLATPPACPPVTPSNTLAKPLPPRPPDLARRPGHSDGRLRANYEENRYDPELILVDIATRGQRVLIRDRRGVSQARWSPDGTRLAFLAAVDAKAQIFVLPMNGGDPWQVTKSPAGVQQYAWRPGGRDEIAYVATDDAPGAESIATRALRNPEQSLPALEAPRPRTLWLIAADGKGAARRLTSGAWTLPGSLPGRALFAAHVVARWQPSGDRQWPHRTTGIPIRAWSSCWMSKAGPARADWTHPATKPSRCFRPTEPASRTGIRATWRT
jgi:dipeptidyl aminopeptidase/acylaminoacyl peptidase